MFSTLPKQNVPRVGNLTPRFSPSTLLIVDPTGEEERLAAGALTVVMDEAGRLCCLHKPGMALQFQPQPWRSSLSGNVRLAGGGCRGVEVECGASVT